LIDKGVIDFRLNEWFSPALMKEVSRCFQLFLRDVYIYELSQAENALQGSTVPRMESCRVASSPVKAPPSGVLSQAAV